MRKLLSAFNEESDSSKVCVGAKRPSPPLSSSGVETTRRDVPVGLLLGEDMEGRLELEELDDAEDAEDGGPDEEEVNFQPVVAKRRIATFNLDLNASSSEDEEESGSEISDESEQ